MYLEDKITSASMATESPVWWSHVAAGGLDVNSKHKKEKLSKKKKKKQRKNWRQTRMWNSCQIEKKSSFSGKTADSTETQTSGTSLRALRLKDPADTQNNTTEKKKKNQSVRVLLRVCWWIKAALTDDLWQRVAAAVGAERGFVPPPLTPFNPDIQTRTRAVNTFTHTQPMFLTLCSLILLRLLLRSDLRGWNWTSLGRSLADRDVFCVCFAFVLLCFFVCMFSDFVLCCSCC